MFPKDFNHHFVQEYSSEVHCKYLKTVFKSILKSIDLCKHLLVLDIAYLQSPVLQAMLSISASKTYLVCLSSGGLILVSSVFSAERETESQVYSKTTNKSRKLKIVRNKLIIDNNLCTMHHE